MRISVCGSAPARHESARNWTNPNNLLNLTCQSWHCVLPTRVASLLTLSQKRAQLALCAGGSTQPTDMVYVLDLMVKLCNETKGIPKPNIHILGLRV